MSKLHEPDIKRWALLRKRYQERGVIIALGAGLSTGCKVPSWRLLLQRVARRCWGDKGPNRFAKLVSELSLPAVAGILEYECPKDTSFRELLGEELYNEFPFHERINSPAKRRQLADFVKNHNSTMRAVGAFCAKRVARNRIVANPRVQAVVNLNVDSVLRSYVRARYGVYLFRTIETASKTRRLDQIPLYHMHGFLTFYPEDRKDGAAISPWVFTEQEYFDFFNRPNSVFNYTFLYLLREFNCVFIGMSMTDDNIRRLLHYSTAERRGKTKETDVLRALRHFAILQRKDHGDVDKLIDLSLRRLGTRALWVDRYSEIPDRLSWIYGEKEWQSVY